MNTKPAALTSRRPGVERGFTLIELTVAMAVFMVIAGAAVSLYQRHAPLFSAQQGQAAMNISLRNAMAQMQLDAVNAGAGFGVNIPGWNPVGITVKNRKPASGTPCNTPATFVYGRNCFDSFSIIAADPTTPSSRPSDTTGACANTNTSPDLYLTPTGTTTVAQLAAMFKSGDQVMLVKSDGSKLTAVLLTANGEVSGTKVKLTHAMTAAHAGNTSTGSNADVNDPPEITTNFPAIKLGDSFCMADWAYKLSVITYEVDTTTETNAKLLRVQNGVSSIIAEQMVGFRVGAMVWNGGDDKSFYSYDPLTYVDYTPPATDWTAVRALRVSLIGRTTTVSPSVNFTNTFDHGRYRVQALSVVINPRNLSMND